MRITEGEPLLLEGGDFFGPGLVGDRDRAELIADAMQRMGYRVIALGESEWGYGWKFLSHLGTQHGFTYLAANAIDAQTGKPLTAPYVIETVAGFRVGVFGVLSPTLTIKPVTDEQAPVVREPLEVVKELVPALRAQCDMVVALLHMPHPQATDLIRAVPGIDLAVIGHDPGVRSDVEVLENTHTMLVRAGDRGQRLAVLRLFPGTGEPEEPPVHVTGDMVVLGDPIPQDAELAADLDRMDKEIKARVSLENARQLAKREMDRGDDHYLGDATCQRCHQEILEDWKGTAHARAFVTLEKTNQEKDPGCVSCHVTGYGSSSGFVDAHASPDLRAVQCEACHGMGTVHGVGYGLAAETSCVTCHTPERSPGFNLKSALRQVKHPRLPGSARVAGKAE